MSNLIQVTIDGVEVKGPFEKKDKTGWFKTCVLSAEGIKYTKFMNPDHEPEFKVGDKVQLLFDTNTGAKGATYNNVKKAILLETSTSKTTDVLHTPSDAPVTKSLSTTTVTTKPSKPTYSTTAQPKDLSMARMNALTNSVNFLTLIGIKDVTESTVFKIADRFVEYTTAPYNK